MGWETNTRDRYIARGRERIGFLLCVFKCIAYHSLRALRSSFLFDPAIWTTLTLYPIRAWASCSSAGETRSVVSCVIGVFDTFI